MKKSTLVFVFALLGIATVAQNIEAAAKLVKEGVALHDKGNYDAAVAKYDDALAADKDNYTALAEKALTLVSQEKFEDAISLCKKIIGLYSGEKGLQSVYVTYGNALDGTKNPEKSLRIYDEGIQLFPSYYQLYFNKGITLANMGRLDEALPSFEKAVALNPKHASSNNAIARILLSNKKKIPALLAFCRLLIVEPQSGRAKEAVELVQGIMKGGAQKKSDSNIVISIDADLLGDTKKGKANDNNFGTTELMLGMATALDFDDKNAKQTMAQQFARKFELVCSSLSETKNKNTGFYWDHYAAYFIALHKEKLVETLSYIVFASSDDEDVAKWLKAHDTEIDNFYAWNKNYVWPKSR